MSSGERILVVEDNELVQMMVKLALENAGYLVSGAANGYELLQQVTQGNPPDLIVLDVGLPDMDGRDLLAALKQDPRTTGIPVLVWSAGRNESDRRIALELGAEDYVQKGLPSRLVPKIERILFRLSERELIRARSSMPARKPSE
jgi:two-component system KDP operon response regulator KdpE